MYSQPGARPIFWPSTGYAGPPDPRALRTAYDCYSSLVFGLPGNPVSAYVCAVLFLVPLIRQLCGRVDVAPVLETARLGCDLPRNDERADYLRAELTDGALTTILPFAPGRPTSVPTKSPLSRRVAKETTWLSRHRVADANTAPSAERQISWTRSLLEELGMAPTWPRRA